MNVPPTAYCTVLRGRVRMQCLPFLPRSDCIAFLVHTNPNRESIRCWIRKIRRRSSCKNSFRNSSFRVMYTYCRATVTTVLATNVRLYLFRAYSPSLKALEPSKSKSVSPPEGLRLTLSIQVRVCLGPRTINNQRLLENVQALHTSNVVPDTLNLRRGLSGPSSSSVFFARLPLPPPRAVLAFARTPRGICAVGWLI